MPSKKIPKSLVHTIRNRIVSGLFAAIPLLVTIFVLKTIFYFLAGILRPLLVPFLGHLPNWVITLISIFMLLVILYCLGGVVSNVFGRRIINKIESLFLRLPLVKPIYHASKQIFESFSFSTQKTFKAVVLIEYPRKGIHSLGFITSLTETPGRSSLVNVFIPTTPNPTSGFTIIVPRSEVIELDLHLEGAMKYVMSAGIISPSKFLKLSKK